MKRSQSKKKQKPTESVDVADGGDEGSNGDEEAEVESTGSASGGEKNGQDESNE